MSCFERCRIPCKYLHRISVAAEKCCLYACLSVHEPFRTKRKEHWTHFSSMKSVETPLKGEGGWILIRLSLPFLVILINNTTDFHSFSFFIYSLSLSLSHYFTFSLYLFWFLQKQYSIFPAKFINLTKSKVYKVMLFHLISNYKQTIFWR